MRDSKNSAGPDQPTTQGTEARKRRVRVNFHKPDALRRIRKIKTFAGYALVFILLFTSLALSLGGVQTLGNAFILIAVFWGLIWWRLSSRLYPRFVGDVAVCSQCGSEVDLVDTWKCPTCGTASSKHILDPCEKCGTRGSKLACSQCGASISV